jgi:hypothetical protein
MSKPEIVEKLNQLVGALALDEQFKREFMQDRAKAIHRFNNEFAPRYYQKPVELSPDELRLIKALNFSSIDEFIALLAIITGSYASASLRPLAYHELGSAAL